MCVWIWRGQMFPDLLHVGFEGVGHGKGGLVAELKDGPVDDIVGKASFQRGFIFKIFGPFFREQMSNKLTPAKRARVAWWILHG